MAECGVSSSEGRHHKGLPGPMSAAPSWQGRVPTFERILDWSQMVHMKDPRIIPFTKGP